MDLLRAKIYLDKINREFNRMLKDPENVPRIDVDITLSYLREMYDAMLSEVETPVAPARIAPAAAPKNSPPPPKPVPQPVIEAAPVPPPVVAAPAPPPVADTPPPVVVAPVVVAPVAPPPVVEVPPTPPVVVAPPPEPVIAKTEPTPAPPPMNIPAVETGDESVLFEYKEARELSEKLSETPISDIKRAIALNDRLLLQRELFGNDHGAFEATLNAVNGFSGFEQAKTYLIREVITPYDWMHKSRIETAKSFIRLIRRRYK